MNEEKDPAIDVVPAIDVATAFEIANASQTLTKAIDLVQEAYNLISSDPIARKYLSTNCEVGWTDYWWKQLTKTYDSIKNKDGKELYHLRAFDGFKLQYPMVITTGLVDGSSS